MVRFGLNGIGICVDTDRRTSTFVRLSIDIKKKEKENTIFEKLESMSKANFRIALIGFAK